MVGVILGGFGGGGSGLGASNEGTRIGGGFLCPRSMEAAVALSLARRFASDSFQDEEAPCFGGFTRIFLGFTALAAARARSLSRGLYGGNCYLPGFSGPLGSRDRSYLLRGLMPFLISTLRMRAFRRRWSLTIPEYRDMRTWKASS